MLCFSFSHREEPHIILLLDDWFYPKRVMCCLSILTPPPGLRAPRVFALTFREREAKIVTMFVVEAASLIA